MSWQSVTIAYRSLTKSPAYLFINLVGLAAGLAAALIVFVYVRYELSYDNWIPRAETTYQLQTASRHNQSGEETLSQMAPYPAVAALRKDFPQITAATYAMPVAAAVLQRGEALSEDGVLFTDSRFFDVLALPFAAGDPETALREPGSIAITQSEARRFFGNEAVLGRTLTLLRGSRIMEFRVAGVLRDLPKNTHLRVSMVGRVDFSSAFEGKAEFLTCWVCRLGYVYVRLRPTSRPDLINAGIGAWKKRNIPIQNGFDAGAEQDWRLTGVTKVHFGANQADAMTAGNDDGTIATFMLIALLILATASINYTNLATARANLRAREVGLRKLFGARRIQLIAQFLGESLVLSSIAMLAALAAAELATPAIASFLHADFRFSYGGSAGMALPAIGLLIAVGFAAGIYPALFLSRFRPAEVLRSGHSGTTLPHSERLRSTLVVLQFAISIGLIICTYVIYRQTLYARTGDFGFAREHVLQVKGLGRQQLRPVTSALEDELRSMPGIEEVGRGGIGIGAENQNNMAVKVPGSSAEIVTGIYPVDDHFFSAIGIKLLAGRSFDVRRPADDGTLSFGDAAAERAVAARGLNIVVNRLTARRMGFRDPEDAVGKTVGAGLLDASRFGLVPATIVGVVENTRFRSIHQPLEPMAYRFSTGEGDLMEIRYSGDPLLARQRVESVWKRHVRTLPFSAEFSEDIVSRLYEQETVRTRAFGIAAAVALLVAALGLFGLASFTVERRTKEIAIRKVLGARIRHILQLLAWQFSKPIVIANLVAWPVSWWVLRDWLNHFDARIALGPTPFLVGAMAALLVGLATISGQALRAARRRPIEALRWE